MELGFGWGGVGVLVGVELGLGWGGVGVWVGWSWGFGWSGGMMVEVGGDAF